jgi:hypothetical protein
LPLAPVSTVHSCRPSDCLCDSHAPIDARSHSRPNLTRSVTSKPLCGSGEPSCRLSRSQIVAALIQRIAHGTSRSTFAREDYLPQPVSGLKSCSSDNACDDNGTMWKSRFQSIGRDAPLPLCEIKFAPLRVPQLPGSHKHQGRWFQRALGHEPAVVAVNARKRAPSSRGGRCWREGSRVIPRDAPKSPGILEVYAISSEPERTGGCLGSGVLAGAESNHRHADF